MCFFLFKQKTAYKLRISDWSSDLCSSYLLTPVFAVFPVFLLLHELRERLRDRRLIRQDVKHPAPLERRTDDLLVELGRDVDVIVGDAVVVRRWGCQACDASVGRDASRGRVGESGITTSRERVWQSG